jgi:hypothetical protein
MKTTIREAALDRATNVRALADRPSHRRNADSTFGGERGSLPRISTRAQMTLRAATSDGGGPAFEGIASATEQPYEMWDFWGPYTEVISAGAFTKTLSKEGLDVPLVLAHDQMRRIARTLSSVRPLQLDETSEGLHVLAPSLNPDDVDVQYMLPKFADELYDEMSFAFRIVQGLWSPDYTEYRITEIDIDRGDVAIVGFGANPFTSAELLQLAESMPEREVRAALASLNLRYMSPLEEPLMARV